MIRIFNKVSLKKSFTKDYLDQSISESLFSYKFFKAYVERNIESQRTYFNNPSIPIIYPTSGLKTEPLGSIFIPLTITEVTNYE